MKSFKSLALACLLSMGALAACGGDDVEGLVQNIKGGSHDEKVAIQECVLNKGIALLKGTTVTPDLAFDAKADDGDYLLVASKQVGVEVNMTMYDVEIEWNIAGSADTVKVIYDLSETQKMVYFNYDENADKTYTFSIKKIKCGRAVSENPQVEYTLNLKKPVYKHVKETVLNLNKITDAPVKKGIEESAIETEYGYKLLNYNQKSPYWTGNNHTQDKDYYYVDVDGELIYSSPDGNWGLIGDGENVMEIYQGSGAGTPISGEGFPVLQNAKYINVVGNMGQYQGNIQIGFITYITESTAANKKTASKTFKKITSEIIDQISTTYTDSEGNSKQSDLQCVPGMNLSNALVEVTGTYVEGSLREGTKAVSRISAGSRATFRLKVSEGHEYTIAYDKHVDLTGSIGFAKKLNDAIASGKPITIKGTNRYNCSDEAPFIQGFSNPGDWQVVPFDLSHISF